MTWNSKIRTDRKHIKHRKTKNYFPKITGRKCRLRQTRTEKNNDHTRIMHKIQFPSYFKGDAEKT